MAATASTLLAEFLENMGLGVQLDDAQTARRINVGLAEDLLGAVGDQRQVQPSELGELLRRIGKPGLKIDRARVEAAIPQGFDLTSFGKIAANMTAGNTQEQRVEASRLRNALFGIKETPADAPDPSTFAATGHAQTIAELRNLSPIEVTSVGKESRITKKAKRGKKVADEFDRRVKFRDTLMPIIEQSGRIINDPGRASEEKDIARRNLAEAQELLAGVGLGSEGRVASETAQGIISGDDFIFGEKGFGRGGTDLESVPDDQKAAILKERGLPAREPGITAEQGSALAIEKAGGTTVVNQPTLRRGTTEFGAGKQVGFGSGVQGGDGGTFAPVTQNMGQQPPSGAPGADLAPIPPPAASTQPAPTEGQTPQTNMFEHIGRSMANAKFQSMVAGLPPELQAVIAPYGEVFAAVGSGSASAEQFAREGTKLADSIAGKGSNLVGEVRKRLEETKTEAIKLAGTTNEISASMLQQQAKETEKRLIWEENEAIRRAEQKKRQLVDAMLNKNAIRGGLGSGAAEWEVQQTELELEQAIDDMRRDFGNKRLDIAKKLSVDLAALGAKYSDAVSEALKEFRAGNTALDQQQFQLEANRETKKLELRKSLMEAVNTARKEDANAKKDIVKEVRGILKEERSEKVDAIEKAEENLQWIFTNTVDSRARRGAIERLRRVGGDVRGLSEDMEISDVAKRDGLSSVFGAGSSEQDIMDMAELVSFGMSVDAGKTFRASMAKKIAGGDLEDASHFLFTQAGNSLKGEDLTRFNRREDQLINIKGIRSVLESEPTYNGFSFVEATKQKALSAFGRADPRFTSIAAPIGQLSSDILNLLSGAAISPAEYQRLKTFVPLMGEGRDNALVKLDHLERNLRWVNEARIARLLGLPVPEDPTLTQQEKTFIEHNRKPRFTPSNEAVENIISPSVENTKMEGGNLVSILREAGFEGDGLRTAYAVAIAESAGRVGAIGDTHLMTEKWGPSVGLFQMRTLKNPGRTWYRDNSDGKLFDPLENAKAAFELSDGGKNWGHWTTFQNGVYRKFLPNTS